MKKGISLCFAILFVITALVFPAWAENRPAVVSAHFKTDLSGLTDKDYEKFVDLSSGDLKFNIEYGVPRVSVYTYSGNPYFEKMKPGRTYNIEYEFKAVDGCDLPETLNADCVNFTCEKRAKVNWYFYVTGYTKPIDGKTIYLSTTVTVDGNFFQLIFGKIADIFLKIRAWSPY